MNFSRLLWAMPSSLLVFIACGSPTAPHGLAAGGQFSTAGGATTTNTGGGTPTTHASNGGSSNIWGTGTTNGGNGPALGGATGSAAGGFSDGGSAAIAGATSIDYAAGGRTTIDVGSGGGTSVDVATGGGFTIDAPTGGGTSVDVATGGGTSVDVATGGGTSVDLGTGGGTSVDLGTGGTGTIDIGCTKTTLSDINVYVIKDATPTGADTEGNMYVGGNLGGTSYSIGAKDASANCAQNPPFYSLVVGGNIDVSGSLVVAGGWGAYEGTVSTGATGFDCGLKHTHVIDFPQLESQVKALSTRMTTLQANGTVSEDASGALVLTGTDKDLNVFNVNASQLGAVTINVPLTSSVVVNVSGTTISWPGAKMTLPGPIRANDDYEFSTHVVWNMYECTSLTIGGIALQGSILAPYATIEAKSGGHVAGQVIVEYLKGNTEYHPYYFSGCITWQDL